MNDNFVKRNGGRKWFAFLLLLAALVLFVMSGKLTDQTAIVTIMLGLLGVFGTANVASEFVARRQPKEPPQ